MAATAAAERGSRNLALSPFWQNNFAQPYYGTMNEEIGAGLARLAAMQEGRKQN